MDAVNDAIAFLKSLINTTKLSKYIPEGFNFNLDPWDPVIENALVHYKMKNEKSKDADVELVLFKGLSRLCTIEIRFAIYEKLLALKDKVKGKDARLLENALMGLEDIMIEPGMIGIVFDLFNDNVNRAIQSLLPLTGNKNITPELEQAIINYSGENDLALIRANVDTSLMILEHELLHNELPKEQFRKLLKIVFKLPCHHAAGLLVHMFYNNYITLLDLLNGCNGKMKNLVATHIFYIINNYETSLVEKWCSYAFLSQIKDERVITLQIKELWEIQEYPVKQDLLLVFYQEITQDLIALKDRRAVPAFISFLYNAPVKGIPSAAVIAEVERLLSKTSWYNEIQKGLQSLRQGENIFIDTKECFNDWAFEKLKKYTELKTKLTGVPPDDDAIKSFLDNEQMRWNEAYHFALNGLRPVDIDISQVEIKMQRLMHDFFQKKYQDMFPSSTVSGILEKLHDYQKEWMITPLTSDIYSTPLVQILRDKERKFTTPALKEHFQKIRKEAINALYIQAVTEFEDNNLKKVKMMLDVLLAIEPGYPFAQHLKKKTTQG